MELVIWNTPIMQISPYAHILNELVVWDAYGVN